MIRTYHEHHLGITDTVRFRIRGDTDIVMKNNKAKAVRFSTLEAICKALDCQPGDILEWVPDEEETE